jgi:flagellar hook-length control protein FliK
MINTTAPHDSADTSALALGSKTPKSPYSQLLAIFQTSANTPVPINGLKIKTSAFADLLKPKLANDLQKTVAPANVDPSQIIQAGTPQMPTIPVASDAPATVNAVIAPVAPPAEDAVAIPISPDPTPAVAPATQPVQTELPAPTTEMLPEAVLPAATEAGNDKPVMKTSQIQENPEVTIDSRPPVQGEVQRNKDDSKVLVTDGPKQIPAPTNAQIRAEQPSSQASHSETSSDNQPETSDAFADIGKPVISEKSIVSETSLVTEKPINNEAPIIKDKDSVPETLTPPATPNNVQAVAARTNQKIDKLTPAQAWQQKPSITDSPEPDTPDFPKELSAPKLQIKAQPEIERDSTSQLEAAGTVATKQIANFSSLQTDPAAPAAPAKENPVSSIVNQVSEPLRVAAGSVGQKITVNLNPPELGRVTVQVSKTDDQLVGRIEIERPQTRDQVESALPKVLQTLADFGVQVKHFEVVMKDPGSGLGRYDTSGSGDSSMPQNRSGNPQKSDYSDNSAPQAGYDLPEDQPSWQINEKAVNIWV